MAKSKSRTYTIPFDKEETNGGGNWVGKVPEDDYLFKVTEMESGTSGQGNPKLTFTFIGENGRVKGKKLQSHLALTPKALWKLRQLLEAAGLDVPASSMQLNPGDILGEVVGITLVDGNPYTDKDGKERVKSEPERFFPKDDFDEDQVEGDEEDDEEEVSLDDMRAKLKASGQKIKKLTDDEVRAKYAALEDDDELEEVDFDEEM